MLQMILQIVLLLFSIAPDLVKILLPLIEGKQPDVASGKMTGDQVRESILVEAKTILATSKPLPTPLLRIGYEVAYMVYVVQSEITEKLNDWNARIDRFLEKFGLKKHIYNREPGLMDWYSSSPDKPRKG